jgi:hypothetical protein
LLPQIESGGGNVLPAAAIVPRDARVYARRNHQPDPAQRDAEEEHLPRLLK